MPKTKTAAKNQSVSRLKIGKKFNPAQVTVVVAAFAIVGAVLIKFTFAASTVHTYYWNTPGIGHTIGGYSNPVTLNFNGQLLTNRVVWTWHGQDNSKGVHMWWGPKITITPPHSSIHVCWYYLGPSDGISQVVYDVYYNNGSGIKYLSWDRDTIPVQSNSPYFQLREHCKDVPVSAGATYHNFEIGVKPVKPPTDGTIKPDDFYDVYKTTWMYN